MRGIVDVFAAYERGVIKSRTRAALAVKRTRGERIGGIPYGYELTADGVHLAENAADRSVVLDVDEVAVFNRALTLRDTWAKLQKQGRSGTV